MVLNPFIVPIVAVTVGGGGIKVTTHGIFSRPVGA